MFAASIYASRSGLQVFFQWATRSLDNKIRSTFNDIKSSYAIANGLQYTAGMDLGLYVTPNCNPNRRMDVQFKVEDVKKMLAIDIGDDLSLINECPIYVTHRLVGDCNKEKPVLLRYHCKKQVGHTCPNYSHRLNKGYGVPDHQVFVNTAEQTVLPDSIVCTYVKECVRKFRDAAKGLTHGLDQE